MAAYGAFAAETPAAGADCSAFIFECIECQACTCGSARCPARPPLTVRLCGALSEFIFAKVGENGSYENVSEYIRDLIRRDKAQAERQTFERLKAELAHAFSAPESDCRPPMAEEVIARAGARYRERPLPASPGHNSVAG